MKAASPAVVLLCLVLCAPALAKDVTLYKVSKGFHYQQPTIGAPTNLTENGYVFEAQIRLPLPGTVTNAIVESSEGTDRVLTRDGDDQFEFRNRVNTRNTLDTRYPEGPFTMTINAVHDGRKVITLPLTGNTYPNAPRIVNIPELQPLNPGGYTVVRWEAFAGGNAGDFIQLRIEDSKGDRAFETRDFGEIGALDGTATYAILEPNTLKPGKTYEATLRFDKTSAYDTTSYPGPPGWSTHHALTRFTITTPLALLTPDVEAYTITKGRRFDQIGPDIVIPDRNDEFVFAVKVEFAASNSVTGVSMSRPAGQAITLTNESTEAFYNVEALTQELLDAAYPNGTYHLAIDTASQGVRSVSLQLSGNAYPPVPRLSNFDPDQPVRADRNLVFEWDPWIGGTANDFIQFRIEDAEGKNIFETRDLGENGSLRGRATWTIVPAGTLKPGSTYRARLQFTRVVALDTTSYPGVLGMATYYSRTKFSLVTGPPDVVNFRIAKGREYLQRGPATVVPHGGYTFSATVLAALPGAVESAMLNVPGRGPVPLALQAGGQRLLLSETRETQGALDAVFPNGTYRLIVRGTNDGLRTLNIDLSGDGYPNPPVINDYEATGQIFPWADFIVSWAPFEGGQLEDFILLEILDRAGGMGYRTGDYQWQSSLSGLDAAVFVPSDSLQPNVLYFGNVMFARIKVIEDAGYPYVTGLASYFTSTRWTLATLGDGNPTSFTAWTRSGNGRLEFTLPTVIGATYVIEGSRDLVNWTTVATISASEEQSRLAVQAAEPHYFYRALLRR